MKLLIAFGTRPEFIKIKPILELLAKNDIDFKILFIGQHSDLISKELEKYEFIKVNIKDGKNRLDSIVSSLMNIPNLWEKNSFSHVLVQGDTTSAFSIALAAFHRKIKVIHLEAGLRTYDYDDPYPEEFNRKSISALTEIHLAPTKLSYNNLKQELVDSRNIFVVGNTVLDSLRNIKISYNNEIIVTMHRRENHSDLEEWFYAINQLALENKDFIFTMPLHPNPNVVKHKYILKDINLIKPLDHLEFAKKLAKSRLVISDSGGIQEEVSFLKKKCIVCRKTTERPEGLNIFSFLCTKPDNLSSIFRDLINDYIPNGKSPYGDGYSANKIIEILRQLS